MGFRYSIGREGANMRRRGGTRPVLWLVSASPTPAGPLRFMLDHSAMVMIVSELLVSELLVLIVKEK